jgi:hypothetical protein
VRAKDAQVQRALLDMSTTAQINDSLKLGGVLLGEIGKVGKLHKPRVEQAGFAVLKAPDIPSVLVETAFISNPDEEARLRSEDYQEQLADALMQGIRRYFAKRNPPLARRRAAPGTAALSYTPRDAITFLPVGIHRRGSASRSPCARSVSVAAAQFAQRAPPCKGVGLAKACWLNSITSPSSADTKPAGPNRLAWRRRRCVISGLSSAKPKCVQTKSNSPSPPARCGACSVN